MSVMGIMFALLILFQMTPSFVKEEYRLYRLSFFSTVIAVCVSLAILGRFYLGTKEEIREHYGLLELALTYLFIGFSSTKQSSLSVSRSTDACKSMLIRMSGGMFLPLQMVTACSGSCGGSTCTSRST